MDYSIAVYSYIDASITSRLQGILKRTLSQSNYLQTATRLICLGGNRILWMSDPIATPDQVSVQCRASNATRSSKNA